MLTAHSYPNDEVYHYRNNEDVSLHNMPTDFYEPALAAKSKLNRKDTVAGLDEQQKNLKAMETVLNKPKISQLAERLKLRLSLATLKVALGLEDYSVRELSTAASNAGVPGFSCMNNKTILGHQSELKPGISTLILPATGKVGQGNHVPGAYIPPIVGIYPSENDIMDPWMRSKAYRSRNSVHPYHRHLVNESGPIPFHHTDSTAMMDMCDYNGIYGASASSLSGSEDTVSEFLHETQF